MRNFKKREAAEKMEKRLQSQEKTAEDIEREILFSSVFDTPDGVKVLEYLRNITIEKIIGPDKSTCALRHMEGRRSIVREIQQKTESGRTHVRRPRRK